MKLLFYKSFVLFLTFTGVVLGQKQVVYHKVYDANRNTVLNIDINKINVAIEESTDGKIHFDYSLEFENYSKKEKQKIIDKIKINTNKQSDLINLKGYSDTEVARVSYSFDLSHVIVDPHFFKSSKEKKKGVRKSKDSILREIRYFEETSIKKFLEKFKFKDQSGKIKKVKTNDVKVMKSKFLVRIPSFVKLVIKAKESSVFMNFDYNNRIILDLEDGKFKSKKLNNTNNGFKIKDATFLSEAISGSILELNNVSRCLIGNLSNINLISDVSKIEVGEVQQNVKIKDFNSEYFLYDFAKSCKSFKFYGDYSKVNYFEPNFSHFINVYGYDTVFDWGDTETKIGPNKNNEKELMLKINRKPKYKKISNIIFEITHALFHINFIPDNK